MRVANVPTSAFVKTQEERRPAHGCFLGGATSWASKAQVRPTYGDSAGVGEGMEGGSRWERRGRVDPWEGVRPTSGTRALHGPLGVASAIFLAQFQVAQSHIGVTRVFLGKSTLPPKLHHSCLRTRAEYGVSQLTCLYLPRLGLCPQSFQL